MYDKRSCLLSGCKKPRGKFHSDEKNFTKNSQFSNFITKYTKIKYKSI